MVLRLSEAGALAVGHQSVFSCWRTRPLVIGSSPAMASSEIARRERFEIVDAFADADEMHGQREFLCDRDQNAAARGAVELGHDEAGDAGDAAENLDLAERVLADRRVEHEQHGVRRFRLDLLHDADHFFEFAHQLGAVLQSPRRIHQQDVRTVGARRVDRIEGEAGGVRALLARDDIGADPSRPKAQLLDRRGAERIARRQRDFQAVGGRISRRACRSSSSCPSR